MLAWSLWFFVGSWCAVPETHAFLRAYGVFSVLQ